MIIHCTVKFLQKIQQKKTVIDNATCSSILCNNREIHDPLHYWHEGRDFIGQHDLEPSINSVEMVIRNGVPKVSCQNCIAILKNHGL